MQGKNQIIISITQDLVDEYNAYYLSKNKRRKKPAIDSPLLPSLNKWMIMKRPMMNALKQRWKDFIIYICEKQGIDGLMIDKCTIEVKLTFHDRRRRDLDNYIASMKFIQDGLSAEEGCGVIIDDSYSHITYLGGTAEFKKGIKQTDIIITY